MAAWGYDFIFSCWKYLSRVSKANEWEILSAREDKILIPGRPCNILYFKALMEILMGPGRMIWVGPYEPKRQLKRTTKSSKQKWTDIAFCVCKEWIITKAKQESLLAGYQGCALLNGRKLSAQNL